MNSTLQCLVHTEPLRNYFLSGEYEPDLNRDNPLGTGGELATQFANLIREVWGLPSKRRNVLGTVGSYASSTSAVYPRNFKHCVGKHAEQFMGYDQHDSQEFATYLLDALHEDTNRITKKPYIEKPEQGEDETDDVAAHKAWGLHLQREDSRVLENFMGQVKSRLECSEDTCNRVSTTFDPFMYLSVPIPGATDRTLKVTFVPLKPNQRSMNLSLTVNKTASLSKFLAKINEKLVNVGICNENIELRDLLAVDVWNHEVFSWYKNDAEIDRIRPTDNTFVYELRAISEIEEASKNNDVKDEYEIKLDESKLQQKYKLNLATMTQLNKDDDWQKELDIYAKNVHTLYSMFNPRRGTIDERMQFHKKLENFIDGCHHEIGNDEPSGLKRTREDSDTDKNSDVSISTTDESIQGLIEHSDRSLHFKGVKSRHDVAVLEFIAKKIRQFILKLVHDKKDQTKDGVIIQVSMKRPQNGIHTSSQGTGFALPLLLRIPPSMSVYDLRKELASRLSRALQSEEKRRTQSTNSGESSAEIVDEGSDPMNDDDGPFGSPELMIMRQVPLTFDRKGTYSSKSSSSSNKQLGMLEKVSKRRIQPQQAIFADPKNEAEKAMVADIVGQQGTVVLEWPLELLDRVFDLNEYETIDDTEANVDPVEKTEALTTVLDCIQKHCQKEQLEETEMWYCNKCAKHVRAWKQFHLYRSPPILIVHLKRFHYSATTHRRDKITSFIDFPLEGLDLTEMVSHYSEEEKPIYNCYAVSNHYGGLGGGHYTAHILNDDGEWCYYDDSRVTTKVDANEVVSEAAYVLYYRRQDVPIGHDVVEQTVPFSYNMIFEGIEDTNPESEISSNNSGLIADEDMAVDGSSPMGSLGGPDIMESSDMGLILPLEEPETANKDSLLQ
jgi:ubiquitin carboxyl-terminal hydrolase 4/11/15